RRLDPVAGHAVQVGNGPPGQRPAPAVEAGPLLVHRLRLGGAAPVGCAVRRDPASLTCSCAGERRQLTPVVTEPPPGPTDPPNRRPSRGHALVTDARSSRT